MLVEIHHLNLLGATFILGRDEKGCKMDVNEHGRASTVDGLEKCSLVNVDH